MKLQTTTTRSLMDPERIRTFLNNLKHDLAPSIKNLHIEHQPPIKASVAAILRWKEKEKQNLEILFIRRTINERDTWSGQIAFPGGKRNTNENTLETAQRETMEEIGLDLKHPHIEWLGSLPTLQAHLRWLHVSTHVFLIHSSEEEHEFTPVIQDVEIANVFWVNVLELMNPIRYRTLSWSIDEAIKPLRKYSWILWSLQKIGLGEMTFPCIYLPRPLPLLPQDKEEENKLFTRRDRYDFILWGLTLRMTSEIFQRGKIPIQINLTAPPVFPSANRLGQILLYIFYRLPKFSIHSNRPSSRL